MGVLTGRFPAKAKKDPLEEGKHWFGGAVKGFVQFAENYGLTLAKREVDLRRGNLGDRLVTGLENFGVDACNRGTEFWKNSR